MEVSKENEQKDNCLDEPIKSSMSLFSNSFLRACKKFSDLAQMSTTQEDTVVYNLSSIINAVCFIEAYLNEQISIGVICYSKDDPTGKPWFDLQTEKKQLKIQEKWDLVAAIKDTEKWNNAVEPFQSLETIISLRNELVHYKGDFAEKDQAPTKKIHALMNKLDIVSQAEWTEDDCSTWIQDLLNSKALTSWTYEKLMAFKKV